MCVLKYAVTQMPASFSPASSDHRAGTRLVCPLLRAGLQMYSMNKLFRIAHSLFNKIKQNTDHMYCEIAQMEVAQNAAGKKQHFLGVLQY